MKKYDLGWSDCCARVIYVALGLKNEQCIAVHDDASFKICYNNKIFSEYTGFYFLF